MKSNLRWASLLVLAALMSSGCGRDKLNSSHYYLEANGPCSIEEIAQNAPQEPIPQAANVRVYAWQNNRLEAVKENNYPAASASIQDVLSNLPKEGHYLVKVELNSEQGTPIAYEARLHNCIITFE